MRYTHWSIAAISIFIAMVATACTTGADVTGPPTLDPSPFASQERTTPEATASPGATDTTATTEPESAEYQPPEPVCPSPADMPPLEPAVASVGNRTVEMTMGGDTITTCSMVGVNDAGPSDPVTPLNATSQDVVRITAPQGWQFLWWEGFDRPAIGEGGNVWPGVIAASGARWIEIPAPSRGGDSVLGFSAYLTIPDGGAVASISGTVLIRMP